MKSSTDCSPSLSLCAVSDWNRTLPSGISLSSAPRFHSLSLFPVEEVGGVFRASEHLIVFFFLIVEERVGSVRTGLNKSKGYGHG